MQRQSNNFHKLIIKRIFCVFQNVLLDIVLTISTEFINFGSRNIVK